jgi:hypothetical protein
MNKRMIPLRTLSAVAAALFLGFSSPAAIAEEEFGGLPEGEGRETVFYACQGCHSLTTVTNQRFSRRVWDEVLVWMVEDQGMAELPEEDHEIVLDYLATHLGIED